MYKYYIRQVGYLYDDSHMELVEGFGGLVNGFDDYGDAEKAIKKLTCEKMRGLNFFQYSPIAFVDKDRQEEMNKALAIFLRDELGNDDIINNDLVIVNYRYSLPLDLTEEQAWEVRGITDLKFYELIIAEEKEPTFWTIKIGKWNTKIDGCTVGVGGNDESTNKFIYKEIPMFFNSRDDAYENIKENIYQAIYGIEEAKINGTLEDLSDTPLILKSFIEQEEQLNYNEMDKCIENINRVRAEKLVILNSLLKDKLVEVVPFSIESALDLGIDWNPAT